MCGGSEVGMIVSFLLRGGGFTVLSNSSVLYSS